MGLLENSDWRARWIGLPPRDPSACNPCPYLRKPFSVAGDVRRARLYATARGLYLASINGRRVAEDLFRPGWTEYRTRLQYQAYDVTPLLRRGHNALGVVLGDGWYCGHIWIKHKVYGQYPQFLGQLEIDYEDGSSEILCSDASWRGTCAGPLLASDLLMGERYDARREMPGWDEPGFDDRAWAAVTTAERDDVALVAQVGPSVRRIEEVAAAEVSEPAPGVYVFDLGQNITGWVRLRVRGETGTRITLRHAEVLNPDGTLYTKNLRTAKCTDEYVLRGGEAEVYEPHFTYRGFRYAELTGYPGVPPRGAVTGIVVHSDIERSGTFRCSSELISGRAPSAAAAS
jgi:alpha-L-rhamnosidase